MPDYFGIYSGMIMLHSDDIIPSGWLACDGTNQPTSSYPALSAAIIGIYGSAPSGFFKLPDLNGSVSNPGGNAPITTTPGRSVRGASNIDIAGSYGGSQTHSHTISSSIIPGNFNDGAHTHGSGSFVTQAGTSASQTSVTPDSSGSHVIYSDGDVWGVSGNNVTYAASGNWRTARANHYHTVTGNGNTVDSHFHAHKTITPTMPSDASGSHNHSTTVTNGNATFSENNFLSYNLIKYIIKT